MRIVRPEPEQTPWQKVGWSREPRNGHEWKMVRDGKPEPQETTRIQWTKPYRCHIHGKGAPYKVEHTADGHAARRCVACRQRNQKRWNKISAKRNRKKKLKQMRALRNEVPTFEEGFATVSATWLRQNVGKVPELLKQGTLVVEMFGIPAYALTTLEKVR